MAIFVAMKKRPSKLPVKTTIGDTNLKLLRDVSAIPYRTLCRWKADDRIPGGDAATRFAHLKAAVAKVKAQQAAA